MIINGFTFFKACISSERHSCCRLLMRSRCALSPVSRIFSAVVRAERDLILDFKVAMPLSIEFHGENLSNRWQPSALSVESSFFSDFSSLYSSGRIRGKDWLLSDSCLLNLSRGPFIHLLPGKSLAAMHLVASSAGFCVVGTKFHWCGWVLCLIRLMRFPT